MKLIASPNPTRSRLLPSGDFLFTAGLAIWLVALEVVGRSSVSDVQDLVAAVALGLAVALTVAQHRRYELPWVTWLLDRTAWFVRRLDRMKYDHGIDLRGEPPYPRCLPRAVWGVFAGLAVWAGLALASWLLLPDGWRTVGTHSFYLGYLVVLSLIWGGLMACIVIGGYIPFLVLDSWLRKNFHGVDRRNVELTLLLTYALVVVAVACFVPTIVVLAFCLVMAVVAGIAFVRSRDPGPAILWRAGSHSKIYAIPLYRLVAGGLAIIALLVFDLLLTSCGGRLFGNEELPGAMPATTLLGTLAAWLMPPATLLAALKLYANRRTDPARQMPPTVHVRSLTPTAVLAAAKLIGEWAWKPRFGPSGPEPGDVGIEVVPAEQSEATEFEPRWPLKVSLDDLKAGPVRDRLARRDEIQIRRRLSRGVKLLFKRQPGIKRRGGGYWFAPHWWFIEALTREDAGRRGEPALKMVGPSYDDAFGPRGRQHLYKVFRAVQVDMVFIEDGVNAKAIERVLRAAFELYDVHAGQRKAEDHHFRGIPKVRVMVHEYSPGTKFTASRGYREPEFSDLNRARVLHVFKDRGGHEELEDVPFDASWEPAPAMGFGF